MKLLTKAIETAFRRPLAPGVAAQDRPVLVKYFDPAGRYTLYVTEANPVGGTDRPVDWELFGYCISPLGPDCDEWGYASLNELQGVRGRFGLGIERDIHFSGTVAEVLKAAA
jgi:hypothetical protein